MVRLFGALAASLLILAACAQDRKGIALPESRWSDEEVARLLDPTPEPRPLEAEEEPTRRPLEDAPLPRRKPKAIAESAAAEGGADIPEVDIDGLVGLDFDATEALLGTPALDEVQAPARIWAYSGSGCVLNIFFYPHVDGGSYRALTYEVKGESDTPDFKNRCFAELVKDNKGT